MTKPLNKTENEIMQEIEKKGYAIIEHGHGFARKSGWYGARRVNARNSLIQKGLIKVDSQSTDRDSHRGFSSIHYSSRVVKA